jgi:RimJ/RimL family protein N-acetyltransferase
LRARVTRHTLVTPDLHLKTLFVLNDEGRITSTREPGLSPGPLFSLVRSSIGCAWAVRADVPDDVARELDGVARQEPAPSNLRDAPVHADRYASLLADPIRPGQPGASKVHQSAGPAFRFPDTLTQSDDLVVVEDERLLQHNFRAWVAGEIAAGSSPVIAVVRDGHPVSICFSARRSDVAAEAGVETAEAFRGHGFGPRVTAAWALAIRASGRIPLYSTSWTNSASLAVARKLGLIPYASDWSLSD